MKSKNIRERIKEYFFVHPTERMRVRQIEKKLKFPLPSVIRYAKELEKEGILKKTTVANVSMYSANRASERYLLEKKLFNMRSLFDSELIKFLISEYHNPCIILFGSYSKGEDVEGSDIDIYIESPASKDVSLNKYEATVERRIQLFVFRNIHKIPNKELANNILNGVILNGFVEIFS